MKRSLTTGNNSEDDCDFPFNFDSNSGRFAVVYHGQAYEESMAGRHGSQLSLAQFHGEGRDDPPFDPFIELEQEEEEDDDDDYVSDDGDDDEEDDDDNEKGIHYRNDGSVWYSKTQLATFQAGAPAGGLFGIVALAGSQFKVTVDDVLAVNRLDERIFQIGTVHELEHVLLVGSAHMTIVGLPTVPKAVVKVMVEEVTQDAKLIVFKKRRRKNSQRRKGFRRRLTLLRILDIQMPPEYATTPDRPRIMPGDEILYGGTTENQQDEAKSGDNQGDDEQPDAVAAM